VINLDTEKFAQNFNLLILEVVLQQHNDDNNKICCGEKAKSNCHEQNELHTT